MEKFYYASAVFSIFVVLVLILVTLGEIRDEIVPDDHDRIMQEHGRFMERFNQ